MLYTADNAKLKINNEEILASNAAISLGANLSPNYLMTQRHTQSQVAGNGIGGTLTFSYYLTGKDYFKTFITGQGERPDRGASELTTQKMSGNFDRSIAFKAACELVFHGKTQPSGYTEPNLHLNRLLKKS